MTHRASPSPLVGALVPLAWIAAAAGGLWLVRRLPQAAFGWVAGAVLGLAILWILVSVLWPARAERTCPSCGRASLRRLDRETTLGLACEACGFVDESASSWYLAEEEGPLEELVLSARRRTRPPSPPATAAGAARASRKTPVDSPPRGD